MGNKWGSRRCTASNGAYSYQRVIRALSRPFFWFQICGPYKVPLPPRRSNFPHSTPSGLVFKVIGGCISMPIKEGRDRGAGVSSFNMN
jgi:hypothetical protein